MLGIQKSHRLNYEELEEHGGQESYIQRVSSLNE